MPYGWNNQFVSVSKRQQFSITYNWNGKAEIESDFGGSRLSDEERLQKILARAGVASRRKSEAMILDGRVTVNGKIVTELGIKVKPRKDLIIVDGKRIQVPDTKNTFWVILNKPKGVLCTMEDGEKDRETVSDLVPKAKELRLLPIGGLDRDSTGLVIMTNDNGWIHPLTHPSFLHNKQYEIIVNGQPTAEGLDKLRTGITLPDEPTRPCLPCDVSIVDYDKGNDLSMLSLSLSESRPQQLIRMMEAISCPMISCKLLQFGPIQLKSLKKSSWRELTTTEITKLKESCKPAKSGTRTSPSRIGKIKPRGSSLSPRSSTGTGYKQRSDSTVPSYKRDGSGPKTLFQKQRITKNDNRIQETKQNAVDDVKKDVKVRKYGSFE
eukprot:gene7396-15101_t